MYYYIDLDIDDYAHEGLGKTIRNISCEEFNKETDDYFIQLYLFTIELVDGDDFSITFTVDGDDVDLNFEDVE